MTDSQTAQPLLIGVSFAKLQPGRAVEDWLEAPVQEAIETGFGLAGVSGSPLVFAAVVDPAFDPAQSPSERIAEARGQIEAYLQSLVDAAGEKGIEASSRLRYGRAETALMELVEEENVELVIVGSRPRRSARDLLVGTTASKLLRYCPCPVLVCKPGRRGDEWTVLVADDLGPLGLRGLELGTRAARRLGARLVVLHAVEFQFDTRLKLTGMRKEDVTQYKDKRLAEEEALLRERIAACGCVDAPGGLEVKVVGGPPDLAIYDAIDDYDADLLVMGTRARTGLPGYLIGNTAERIFPRIKCSLLAIKPERATSSPESGDRDRGER